MRHVKIVVLFAVMSFPAHGAVGPGDYVFVYGRLLGCGDTIWVVDFAEISQNGEIEVLEGIQVSVLGLTEEQLAFRIATEIGAKTGRSPKTLSVAFVPVSDSERIARELMNLTGNPICAGPSDSPPQPPVEDYGRRLASAPPNKSSMDSSVK